MTYSNSVHILISFSERSRELQNYYNVTLRKLSAQLPLRDGFVTEYVPPTLTSAVVAPDGTALGGNVSVSTALTPGARLAIGGGADSSEAEPRVVPGVVT